MATKTIKASGGDYTTLNAWFSALPATLTEPEIAVVDAMLLGETFIITGKTQTASEYIEIRVDAANRHTGMFGTGARVVTPTGDAAAVRINMPFVRIYGLSMYQGYSSIQGAFSVLSGANVVGSDVRVDGCLIGDAGGISNNYTVLAANIAKCNLTFTNNIVCGDKRSADFRTIGSLKEHNNIYWRRNNSLGVLRDASTTSSNNYSGGSVSGSECFWTGGTAPSGSNNISSDTTATIDTPTGSVNSVSGASVFASVVSGAEDFRPLSGTTALHNAGTTVTVVTTDAAGVVRPQGAAYDVGAFEFVETTSGATSVGNLVSSSATIAATAARSGAVVTHASTGALVSGSSVIAAAASRASAGVASFSTPPIKNNTGTVRASTSGWTINVFNVSTGALVVQKTGLSTDASGVIEVSDAALVSGTSYAYEAVNATYGRGLPIASAA